MRLRSSATNSTMAPCVISVVGGLNMDMVFETLRVPDVGESIDGTSLETFPGGKGANTAIATYRGSHNKPSGRAGTSRVGNGNTVDIRVFMNGMVGNDEFGRQLKARLEENGIDVSGVLLSEGERSGTCVVMVESGTGESRNLAYQGANLKWKPRIPRSVTCLANGEKPDLVVAHLGIPREQVEKVLSTATSKGVDTLLNPSPALHLVSSTFKNLTHLIMNESEAAELTSRDLGELDNLAAWQSAAKHFLDLGVKNVVITLGAKGAYYATNNGDDGVVDAVKNVKVRDATGAGDTFVGNYSIEYITQKHEGTWDIVKAIDRACKASAKTIERFGAQEAIPWADETDA
ncbi:putative Ribokinase [Seiridium unicorne]|uniref:Ribokinase n=1 Tax=Seiridium unicorne TaxID=138068 RepID=A0ABR2V906_9PEZI